MANQEHLDLLTQGWEIWNQWRNEHPDIRPDLRDADLTGANLLRANLSRANFARAHLVGADFRSAHLSRASLWHANLMGAHLVGADLRGADFRDANLMNADLRDAELMDANLMNADLTGADFRQAGFRSTILANVDLSVVRGLGTVQHSGPSTIGIDTIICSQGKIPESFLREAGLPDSIIEAIPSLVGSLKPIDYYSCFISYSSKDQDFAERLHADLQSKGVRCWFAPEDMKTGDEIRSRIDEAIRMHDKLLLVLSEHSVESSWVKKEVETAFEKEDKQKRFVLFPVRVDDTVMQTTKAWAADIHRMRYITDFRNWKDHDAYQKAFTQLLRDLKAEAAKTEAW